MEFRNQVPNLLSELQVAADNFYFKSWGSRAATALATEDEDGAGRDGLAAASGGVPRRAS